ncbi:hypothetical protein EV1_024609 [Malus domestica]
MCSSQPSRIKPQRPLKKLPAKFKIKPRRPLRKSQVRFKIKRPPPLNQIQFKNKLRKVNNWRNPENPPTQFKIKVVESQQAQKNKYVPIHSLPKPKIIYHMKLLVVQFQPSRSSLDCP